MGLLRVENLIASYGQIVALKEVTFHVNPGEAVALLGSNGAGKTTTLSCLSSIHRQKSGSLFFDNQDISDLPAHDLPKLGLALVPEGRKIFPRLTVYENLQLGAFTRTDHQEVTRDIEYAFRLFPILLERRAQLGGTLSGGEQQMLAIARALMSRPKMLLLDEPSMGIAPLLVKKIFEALDELKKSGMTILLVEQNANMALRFAERAYVLETGEIVLSGDAKDLIRDERVRECYLGG